MMSQDEEAATKVIVLERKEACVAERNRVIGCHTTWLIKGEIKSTGVRARARARGVSRPSSPLGQYRILAYAVPLFDVLIKFALIGITNCAESARCSCGFRDI